ncbi:MAG: hypothetical protein ACKPE2_21840, partial [Dolichospermum sp.]
FFITLLLLFVWLLTILIARNRKRSDREHHHEALVASLRTDCDRINSFLSTETQIFVSWMSLDGVPNIRGDLAALSEAIGAKAPLSFNSWLSPKLAQRLDAAVKQLRLRGEAFHLMLEATNGRHIEA